jgi:hypothetical protein
MKVLIFMLVVVFQKTVPQLPLAPTRIERTLVLLSPKIGNMHDIRFVDLNFAAVLQYCCVET